MKGLDTVEIQAAFNFNFCNPVFRKSPFCTFSCVNPGFGGPLNMLWNLFLIAIFIMLQKKDFGKEKLKFSCTGSKVPFCQFFIFAKMALFYVPAFSQTI